MQRDAQVTCKEFIAALVDYLARDLPKNEQDAAELHLSVCPDCVKYLASYEVTIRLGKVAMQADEADGDAPLPDDLVQVILSARKK